MKKFKLILTSALLAFSTFASANGVMMEMFQMKKHLNVLTQAEDSAQFEQAADAFLVQAEKARDTMPASLEGDEERFEGYQKGMQEVIDTVKQAKDQAKQNKLADAKTTLEALNDMKKKYHAEYK